jgi:hypothetical protein
MPFRAQIANQYHLGAIPNSIGKSMFDLILIGGGDDPPTAVIA